MKTNHRTGSRTKRRGYNHHAYSLHADIKADARTTRRAMERRAVSAIQRGVAEFDDVAFPTRNAHVANASYID